ncbi:hypothetical protein [Amycolatopsis japonica]
MPPRTFQATPGAGKLLLSEFAMDLESDIKGKRTIRNYAAVPRKLHI